MNLTALAQIAFLVLSSIVIASASLSFFALLVRKKAAILIPVTSPESAFFITEKNIIIGRSHDADVMVIDESVSQKHCQLFRKGDRYFVKDLNSKNGTFLNGQPVIISEIRDGDMLTIGERKFIFRTELD